MDKKRVKTDIKKDIKHFLELDENENMIYQNLWDMRKGILSI